MRSRVLLTGGGGFIGSHLATALLADGYAVDIVDNFSTGFRENVPSDAELLELDLSRPDDVARLPVRKYEAILHLAGQCSGERSFDVPHYDLQANAGSTLLLAEWALTNGIGTLLHASSMGVYGEVNGRRTAETDRPEPLSYYGASKLAAERILSVAAKRGLRTCSFRMFTVYGRGQDLTNMKQGMVSIYLAYLLRTEPVQVKGSLERTRDFVHVDDVVRAWRLGLENTASGIFNIGTGVGTSVRELLDELLDACGLDRNYPVEETSGTPGDQSGISAEIGAIGDAFGWTPRIDLRTGLADMVEPHIVAAEA